MPPRPALFRVSLWSTGCFWNSLSDQAGFRLRDPPASALPVRLKVWTTPTAEFSVCFLFLFLSSIVSGPTVRHKYQVLEGLGWCQTFRNSPISLFVCLFVLFCCLLCYLGEMGTTAFYKELPQATGMSSSWPTAGSLLFQMVGPLEGCVSYFSGSQTLSFSTRICHRLLMSPCRQFLSLYAVPSKGGWKEFKR